MSITPRTLPAATLCAAVLLLAACASRPPAGGRDGPEASPPTGLERVPDAEPRVEALRSGGPNKPYEVLGERYTPVTGDRALREKGLASWYGRKFHGRPTASGEPYDMYAMTAAHKTMPLPSYARVRNPANGREIVVRVNDRGPFSPGRVIDLSYTAALKLGVLGGVAPVEVERITNDEIRAGLWKRDRTVAEPERLPATDDDALPAASSVPAVAAGPGVWLQVGAFRQRDGALAMQQRVQREAEGVAPGVAVLDDSATWRVHVGPYATRGEAGAAAERLRGLLLVTPLLIERR